MFRPEPQRSGDESNTAPLRTSWIHQGWGSWLIMDYGREVLLKAHRRTTQLSRPMARMRSPRLLTAGVRRTKPPSISLHRSQGEIMHRELERLVGLYDRGGLS